MRHVLRVHSIPALVVGHDDDDVGRRRGACGRSGRDQGRYQREGNKKSPMSPEERDGQSQRVHVVSHVLLGVGAMAVKLDLFAEPAVTQSLRTCSVTTTARRRLGRHHRPSDDASEGTAEGGPAARGDRGKHLTDGDAQRLVVAARCATGDTQTPWHSLNRRQPASRRASVAGSLLGCSWQ